MRCKWHNCGNRCSCIKISALRTAEVYFQACRESQWKVGQVVSLQEEEKIHASFQVIFFFSFGCEMEVDLMIHRGYQDDGSENRTLLFIKSLNGSYLQT